MSKPRLLVLTSTFPRWPDDHEPPFVFELARRLTDDFEVTVLAPHAPGAARQERMAGVWVERFRYGPDSLERLAYDGGIPAKLRRHPWLALLVPLFLMAQCFTAWRLIRRNCPCVVHAHWVITGGLVGRLLRLLCRHPFRLVVTAHGGDVYGLNHPLLRRLKGWVLRDADAVTAVSQALAGELMELGAVPEQITVQAMGTDLHTLFTPRDQQPTTPTLIYAGRLVAKKGVDTLLQACAGLRDDYPQLNLLIAGHGPEKADLQRLARELDIAEHVRMIGPYKLTELPDLYAGATLAVFPFRVAEDGDQDGLGLAIVEAMGCGVPVITSHLPVLGDLVEDGVSGRMVAADDPVALADCIRECLDEPLATKVRADTARQRVLINFDWVPVSRRYVAILTGDPDIPAGN